MKKVLSLVLSLCLIVSLGAGISFDVAQAADENGSYYYDLTVGASAAGAQVTGLTSYDAVNALDTSNKSDDWCYFSSTLPASNGSYCHYMYKDAGLYLRHGAYATTSSIVQLKIKVDVAGKYVPILKLTGSKDWADAGTFYASIKPLSGTTVGEALATNLINMNSVQIANQLVPITTNAIELAAGEYILELEVRRAKASCKVDGLNLVNATGSAVASSLTLGKDERLYEVNVGEKIEVPISGVLSNGTALDIATTSDWQIPGDTASVHCDLNKANGTLDITGLAETTTNETWTISIGSAMCTFNVKVNPAGYVKPGADLYYDFKKGMGTNVQNCVEPNFHHTFTYGLTTTGAYGDTPTTLTSNAWAWHSENAVTSGNQYLCRLYPSYGFAFTTKGTLNLKFIVPVDGKYLPAIDVTTAVPAVAITYSIKSMDGATTYASKTIPASTAIGKVAFDAPVDLYEGEYLLEINKSANGTAYISGLYADYKGGLTYNVTLNAGEGTVATPLTSYTHGTAVTLPAVTAPEGYTFDGWFDANDNKVTEIAATARGDKAYTAQYTEIPKVYTVTLNANGGTLASELTSYTGGVGATLPTATKGIATFGGWYDNADFIGDAVTAIGTDATGDKEFWAKWTVEIPESAVINVTSDSGYYAEKIDSADKEGVIAVSTYFSMFSSLKAEISKVGVMVYTAGNEANEAKIARVETTDAAKIDEINDTFTALFEGIEEENFGKEVIAKPYLVVSGEYVYGDAVELDGVNAAKWIGPKA